MFENLGVMEAVKTRTNCGKEPNSHFLRTESVFDFARNVRSFMRDDGRVRSARVIYDGADYDLSDGVQARNLRSAFSSGW